MIATEMPVPALTRPRLAASAEPPRRASDRDDRARVFQVPAPSSELHRSSPAVAAASRRRLLPAATFVSASAAPAVVADDEQAPRAAWQSRLVVDSDFPAAGVELSRTDSSFCRAAVRINQPTPAAPDY